MLTLPVDHNMEGQAVWLWDTILKIELPDIIDIRMVMFADIGLPENSNDRVVWRFAQQNHMILLTDNRSDNESDSLEQTIREENGLESLPVLTIGCLDRMKENYYRVRCAERVRVGISVRDRPLGVDWMV